MNIGTCAAPARPLLQAAPILLSLLLSLLLAGCASPAPGTDRTSVELPSVASKALQCALGSNCVNSLDGDKMAPLRFSGTAAQGLLQLQTVLSTFPEATIVQADPALANDTRLDTVFTTPVGFKDRVTFIVDAAAGRIDFRSKSTLGLYDFGKNRKRMTAFTARFNAAAEK
jgi:uncharacterized protein (DUF1499 family)